MLQGKSSTTNVLETLAEADGQNQHLVLAIDDNPDVINLINNALENSPYRVIGVNDSSKAVEVVQKLQPTAVTLDVMMPEVNGWQILHQLRANPATSNVPVIMLTVLEDRSAAHVLGADEYLVKPVDRDTLLNTLRQVATHNTLSPVTVSSVTTVQGETENSASSQQQFLVLNTEPSEQAILERVLSEAGLTVKIATTETDMLNIIQTSKPDVIVLRVIPDAAKEQ
jgi:DNA-binding response OmpR family regulator